MRDLMQSVSQRPLIIAALHLPPFLASGHPDAQSNLSIIDHALRNAALASEAGVEALYIQDLGDHPWARSVQPHTLAMMSMIGGRLRQEFPDLILGVCTMSHGAREPIAIAQAIGAQFVRLKVFVGAMVKAEGILEGCAHEAVTYRSQCRADGIAILADVYDRTGIPLGEPSFLEAAREAALFGRADGLIITGRSLDESLNMLSEVKSADLGVPLFLGGGANAENIARVLTDANGVIVSTAFKANGAWKRSSLAADWDAGRTNTFMQAVDKSPHE